MESKASELENWLSQILDSDAVTFENAYWGLRPDTDLVVPRLLDLLQTTHDSYSRGKLLELLGESGDLSVASVITSDLEHPDETIRNWANTALSALREGASWQQTD